MTSRSRLVFAVFLALILLAGAYGRVTGISDRPFWSDEAWVAKKAVELPYGQLFRQTDVPIPPLFAVAVKAFNSLAARPELGLRLFPLLCGLGVPLLSYSIMRTLRAPRSVILAAMALTSGNTMLVVWSRELKPYEVESLFSLALAFFVFRLRRSDRLWMCRLWCLGVLLICLIAPWFGYGFVFAAVPLLGILAFCPPVRGLRRECRFTGMAALIVLACSTVALLGLIAQAQAGNPALRKFTSTWFINLHDTRSWWLTAGYFCVTGYTTVMPQYLSAMTTEQVFSVGAMVTTGVWVSVLIGLYTWPREGRTELSIYVLAPWVLLLLAAIAGEYPFANPRMMVMWVAPMLLAMGAGLVRIGRTCSLIVFGKGGPGMILGVVLALVPLGHMLVRHQAHTGWVHHDFPPLLEIIRKERRSGETVIATTMASAAVDFYAKGPGLPITYVPTSGGTCELPDFDYDDLIRKMIGNTTGRVWMLTVQGNSIPDRTRGKLFDTLADAGYRITLRAADPDPCTWGTAALFCAEK